MSHSPPHRPILYSFRRCPYAMRARMALYLSGQAVQLREVVLRDKPRELLLASPKGSVPVLILGNGDVIDQSMDIMRWAFALNDPLSCSSHELAAQLDLIDQHDAQFKPLLDRYKYPERHPSHSAAEHQYHAMYWLKAHIEIRLEQYTHLMGNQLSLADLAIMPFVRQCAGVDARAFEQLASPKLQHWLAQLCASPLFNACMEKYPAWQSGTPAIIFAAPSSAQTPIANLPAN